MSHYFIPARKNEIARVVCGSKECAWKATLPIVAWRMISRGNGTYFASPVFAVALPETARIGVHSRFGTLTTETIYRDRETFESAAVLSLPSSAEMG